jgi:hypothetical protein
MKYKQFNFKIEPEIYEWLRKKAFDERKRMAEVIRELLQKEKDLSK